MDFSQIIKNIEETYKIKHRELNKRQREYKKFLALKADRKKLTSRERNISRGEDVFARIVQETSESLKKEKNDLRKQIWIANGAPHRHAEEVHLRQIKCHIECQDHLSEDIQGIKTHIANMEREINRITQQVYELNCKTVPDSRYQQYVLRARKKLAILENSLDIGVRQECELSAKNATLREELGDLIHFRTDYNIAFGKMVAQLNSERKYMIELIEYVIDKYDGCVTIYDKMDYIAKKDKDFNERTKEEVYKLFGKSERDEAEHDFIEDKIKPRGLADLPPKEYARREKFYQSRQKKINLYSKIIEKILAYTKSDSIRQVIGKYQQQESIYYSYFNFSNEMDYHMTLLNDSVRAILSMLEEQKVKNTDRYLEQTSYLESLQAELKAKSDKNAKLKKTLEQTLEKQKSLTESIRYLLEITGCDLSPLEKLLGHFEKRIDLHSLQDFLKVLEKRIFEIAAWVHVWERQERNTPASGKYTVLSVGNTCEEVTPLDDIVLTQQCPECAEGEAFNVEDTIEGTVTYTQEQMKTKLREKVYAPEMQYRLHRISQCRLPRSRVLAAKRNA